MALFQKTIFLSLLIAASSCAIKDDMVGIKTTGSYTETDQRVTQFSGDYPYYQQPIYFSYEELVQFSENPEPPELTDKLAEFWTTPIIDNRAFFDRGVRPVIQHNERLGDVLRVATWNIEKSYQVEHVAEALQSESAYRDMIDPSVAEERPDLVNTMLRQRERIANADIIFLQEMDIGVRRSGYINAPATLARALDMNYAYGTQTLEVDPFMLGTETMLDPETGEASASLYDQYVVDPERYKGMFGSAVLSRYPIRNVEVFQLQNHVYDWFHGEIDDPAVLEDARRLGSKIVFQNVITRERKVGGRNYMRVDLEVPGIAENDTLTIINIHLEIKARPEDREDQIKEILGYIKEIPNPVIMAGDFNSSSNDLSPTSTQRVLVRSATDPATLFSFATNLAIAGANVPNNIRMILNGLKNYNNPLVWDIPIIAENPVHGLLEAVEDFRFSDGTSFDFRGDDRNSMHGRGRKLSNANERAFFGLGFTPSFTVKRPLTLIGRGRLDWIFVRSGELTDPTEDDQSYRLAPHYGETLTAFNEYLIEKFSDHRPLVVDIPLNQPNYILEQQAEQQAKQEQEEQPEEAEADTEQTESNQDSQQTQAAKNPQRSPEQAA